MYRHSRFHQTAAQREPDNTNGPRRTHVQKEEREWGAAASAIVRHHVCDASRAWLLRVRRQRRNVASGPRNGRVFVKRPSPKLTFYVVRSGGSPTLDCTLGPLGPPIQSPTRRRLSPRYCACARRLDLQVARADPLRMARSEEAVRSVELPVLAGGDDLRILKFPVVPCVPKADI
jgi:hypothetical protein